MNDTVAARPADAQASKQEQPRRQPPDRRVKALEKMFGERFVHTFQGSYLVLTDHRIDCPVGIRLYKKDFEYLSKQLYVEYQYRIWHGFNRELLDRYADITNAKLTAIDTLMQQNINRLTKLLDQQGFRDELSLFPSPHITDVPIIASAARVYITALGKMDRLYALAGTANLVGVIDSQQRAEVELVSKKAFRAFRSILQNEVGKIYREARRVIEDQHKGTGVVDANMAQVVEEQGRDLEAFKKDSEAQDLMDPQTAMGGADPSQVLDDVAAATAAASAAAGATRKRTAKPRVEAAATAPAAPEAATSESVTST